MASARTGGAAAPRTASATVRTASGCLGSPSRTCAKARGRSCRGRPRGRTKPWRRGTRSPAARSGAGSGPASGSGPAWRGARRTAPAGCRPPPARRGSRPARRRRVRRAPATAAGPLPAPRMPGARRPRRSPPRTSRVCRRASTSAPRSTSRSSCRRASVCGAASSARIRHRSSGGSPWLSSSCAGCWWWPCGATPGAASSAPTQRAHPWSSAERPFASFCVLCGRCRASSRSSWRLTSCRRRAAVAGRCRPGRAARRACWGCWGFLASRSPRAGEPARITSSRAL
mmetsp:Transcript_126890/g.344510  ORF Transcript_126890/g.344510 Transcript_126890/m.344510 type:complete len:286 (+) Transcript_126890:919-1776(+)